MGKTVNQLTEQGAEPILDMLESGRGVLREAPRHYGRELGPEQYWWLGVALAAVVLAEVNRQPLIGTRVESAVEDLLIAGVTPDRVEQLANELAQLDSLGLLWPLYQRTGRGWERQPIAINPDFGPEEAYWVSLGHIAAALLGKHERAAEIPALAGVLGEIITGVLRSRHEQAILAVYQSVKGAAIPDGLSD